LLSKSTPYEQTTGAFQIKPYAGGTDAADQSSRIEVDRHNKYPNSHYTNP